MKGKDFSTFQLVLYSLGLGLVTNFISYIMMAYATELLNGPSYETLAIYIGVSYLISVIIVCTFLTLRKIGLLIDELKNND